MLIGRRPSLIQHQSVYRNIQEPSPEAVWGLNLQLRERAHSPMSALEIDRKSERAPRKQQRRKNKASLLPHVIAKNRLQMPCMDDCPLPHHE